MHHRVSRVCGQRFRKQETLAGLTSELAQTGKLVGGFDALGLHTHVNALGERHDDPDDLRLRGDLVDERPVDLERVGWQPLQIVQRRVAGAEVIDAEL